MRRALLLAVFAAPAFGQTAPILDARSAEAIVTGCAADAAAKHQSEAIAVVDTGGHLITALRMDGNGSGIFDFALAKAEALMMLPAVSEGRTRSRFSLRTVCTSRALPSLLARAAIRLCVVTSQARRGLACLGLGMLSRCLDEGYLVNFLQSGYAGADLG